MDFGDIIDAQRLCTLARLRNGQYSGLFFPVLLVLGAACGFVLATHSARVQNWLIGIAIGLFLFALSILRWASRLAQRLQTSGPTTCTVTDQGLRAESTITLPAGSSASTIDTGVRPWSTFIGYVDAPRRILLLYPSRAFFNFTKSGLSGVETSELLSIVSKNLRRL
jgi:hypothetical protein